MDISNRNYTMEKLIRSKVSGKLWECFITANNIKYDDAIQKIWFSEAQIQNQIINSVKDYINAPPSKN